MSKLISFSSFPSVLFRETFVSSCPGIEEIGTGKSKMQGKMSHQGEIWGG